VRKILIGFIVFSSFLNAAVFDYRLYYGSSNRNEDNIFSYSSSVYSYFDESDFAYGVQLDFTNINKESSIKQYDFSAVLGYDFSRIFHGEIFVGGSSICYDSTCYKGAVGGATFLVQTNFDGYLEALQVGVSGKYANYEQGLDSERNLLLFIGFWF